MNLEAVQAALTRLLCVTTTPCLSIPDDYGSDGILRLLNTVVSCWERLGVFEHTIWFEYGGNLGSLPQQLAAR